MMSKKLMYMYLAIIGLTLLYIVINGTPKGFVRRFFHVQKKVLNDILFPIEVEDNLISTPGCVLPTTQLLPDELNVYKNLGPRCDSEKVITYIDDDNETLTLTDAEFLHAGEKCYLREIKHSDEDFFNLGRQIEITDDRRIDLSSKELVATKCGTQVSFDAHFPLTPDVKKKIHKWKYKQFKNPVNVLLMGFASTSRSHFHRSLQETVPLMKSMDFIDFHGFHATSPDTLENFLAFLLGKTLSEVRAFTACASSINQTKSFDNCPFIWKHFDLHNFITMFTEDDPGTFNTEQQKGFTTRPTDYYPLPLFQSMLEHRKEINNNCVSKLNIHNYMLEYTKRFLVKFQSSPFFAFSWFSNPLNDSVHALYRFDQKLVNFFENLNSQEMTKVRENTLIIVFSDHGHGHGNQNRDIQNLNINLNFENFEGFMERALPGLFIRLPENLLEQFPEMKLTKTMELNSKRLTSAFDIHHTLLHLLHMQGLEFETTESLANQQLFDPSISLRKRRRSLFQPLSNERTCEDLSIPVGICVCNAKITSGGGGIGGNNNNIKKTISISNPFFVSQLIDFAIKELNSIVNNSKYSNACAVHDKPLKSLVSANIIPVLNRGAKEDIDGVLLRFSTSFQAKWPRFNSAMFETRIGIRYENGIGKGDSAVAPVAVGNGYSLEIWGPFHRLDFYGDSSWCVDFRNSADIKMVELCRCNEDKPKSKSKSKPY